MGTIGENYVNLHYKRIPMGLFSKNSKIEETLVIPQGKMPWPVKDDHIWLVTGVLAPDCLELTYDLSFGILNRGFRLQSFPYWLSKITAQELNYNFPGTGLGLGDVNEMEFRKTVASALGMEMNPAAGYFIRKNPDGDGFLVAEITAKTNHSFLKAAQGYFDILPDITKEEKVKYSKVFKDSDEMDLLGDIEGVEFYAIQSPEIRTLAQEAQQKIQDLIMQDFPIEIIETWLQKAVKLSHLKVTVDYRILLPDYNKEIKLRQLPKTLFLFFLRHPEGCRLKDLSDHRQELLDIYRKLTISDDQAQVEASINALVDAQGNSFSEKCSAIKLAFLNEISDRIAQNYYVCGPQGGVKGISLDRALVEWEE